MPSNTPQQNLGSKLPTIAQALKEEMLRTGAEVAWSGDPDLMLAAYQASGGSLEHPLDCIAAVLRAARKSPLFVSDGYIRACDSTGRREILHPCFVIKAETQAQGGEGVQAKASRA